MPSPSSHEQFDLIVGEIEVTSKSLLLGSDRGPSGLRPYPVLVLTVGAALPQRMVCGWHEEGGNGPHRRGKKKMGPTRALKTPEKRSLSFGLQESFLVRTLAVVNRSPFFGNDLELFSSCRDEQGEICGPTSFAITDPQYHSQTARVSSFFPVSALDDRFLRGPAGEVATGLSKKNALKQYLFHLACR